MMIKRKLILGSFLAGLITYAYLSGFLGQYFFGERTSYRSLIDSVTPSHFKADENTTVGEVYRSLQQKFRLKPDNRFTVAVGRILEFDRDKSSQIDTHWNGSQWNISFNGKPVASVDDIPSFPAMLDSLHGVARKRLGELGLLFLEKPDIATEEPVPDARKLMAELQRLNSQWSNGSTSVEDLVRAARLMAILSLVSVDPMDSSDSIGAQALALLALAQVASGDRLAETESILAYSLGYTTHAKNLETGLEPATPWQLFLARDDVALEARVTDEPGDPFPIYLLLKQVSKQGDTKRFAELFSESLKRGNNAISFLEVAYEAEKGPDIDSIVRVAALNQMGPSGKLVESVWTRLEDGSLITRKFPVASFITSVANEMGVKERLLVNKFEELAEYEGGKYSGPFFSRSEFTDYYSGYFYGSLYRHGKYLLDRLSSVPAAEAFDKVIGDSDRGRAKALQQWLHTRVDMANNKKIPGLLDTLLLVAKQTGPRILLELIEDQAKTSDYGDPTFLRTVEKIAPRLDSRIDNRLSYAKTLRRNLMLLPLSERIYASITRDAAWNNERLASRIMAFQDDMDGLLKVATNPTVDPQERAYATSLLDDESAPISEKQEVFEKLITIDSEWSTYRKYSDWLADKKRYGKRVSILNDWLQKNPDESGFDMLNARAALADSLMRTGYIDEAWNVINPIAESWKGNVLKTLVEVALRQEKWEIAISVAIATQNRYPNSAWAMAEVLRVLWAAGEYTKAAERVRDYPRQFSSTDWAFTIAPKFTDTLKQMSVARPAFKALMDAGVPHVNLKGIADDYDKKGYHEMAFEMMSQLRYPGYGQLALDLASFSDLSKSKGNDVAMTWLKKRGVEKYGNVLAMLLFDAGQYDLLWKFIPNPDAGEHPDAVWLYRVAGALLSDSFTPERRKMAESWYASAGKGSRYNEMGRYLLGQIPIQELLAISIPKRKTGEIAYFIGVKAFADGNIEEAANWWRVALESGTTKEGEYRWAYNQLYSWSNEEKTLETIAQRDRVLLSDVTVAKGQKGHAAERIAATDLN